MKFFIKQGSGNIFYDMTDSLIHLQNSNFIHIPKGDKIRNKIAGLPSDYSNDNDKVYIFTDEGHFFEVSNDEECYIDVKDEILYINELPFENRRTLDMVHQDLTQSNLEDYNVGHIDGMNIYVPFLNDILLGVEESVTSILELASRSPEDKSFVQFKLFYDYFTNLKKYDSVDMIPITRSSIPNSYITKKIEMKHTLSESEKDLFNEYNINNTKFDLITIHGTHDWDKIKERINNCIPLLSDKGMLIIKDINTLQFMEELYYFIPKELRDITMKLDLNGMRYHVAVTDNLLIINKNKNKEK